jgi:hypothetical protein
MVSLSPVIDPHWDYNSPVGMQRRVHMIEAILCGMKSKVIKSVNYNRIKRLIQEKENLWPLMIQARGSLRQKE